VINFTKQEAALARGKAKKQMAMLFLNASSVPHTIEEHVIGLAKQQV